MAALVEEIAQQICINMRACGEKRDCLCKKQFLLDNKTFCVKNYKKLTSCEKRNFYETVSV